MKICPLNRQSRKNEIQAVLNTFPEVTWDRWSGSLDRVTVYGWIARADTHADFLVLRISAGELVWFMTSSATYSRKFAARLGCGRHTDCERVEHDFPGVKSIKLALRKQS